MLIIFGIRRKAYRLATVFALCRLCGSPAAQVVSRVRTFFSLFFVPIIPMGSTYRSTCSLCGRTVKITKEEADQLVAHAQSGAPTPARPPAVYPPPAMPGAPSAVSSGPPAVPSGPPVTPPSSPPPTTGP